VKNLVLASAPGIKVEFDSNIQPSNDKNMEELK